MTESEMKRFIEVYNDILTYRTVKDVADELGINPSTVRRRANALRGAGINLTDRSKLTNNSEAIPDDVVMVEADEDILAENVRLAKNHQRLQDKLRIQGKTFREYSRAVNAVEELSKDILEELKRLNLSDKVKFHNKNSPAVGVIHWSDQHLNEQVYLSGNQYNWEIAAKRLKKHVDISRQVAKSFGIKKILVAMTGDLLNSDRRLDELLGNSNNRAKACVLAADLYQQALLDLNQDFDLTVAGVSGNESRIPKDVGWQPDVASDNYDFTIYEILKRLLDSNGIQFIESYDPSEVVIEINGQHILLMHGHGGINNSKPTSSVQQIKGRYNAKGVKLDMVIWGHVHEAMIADLYARSSSLVGANDYSEKALNLDSRASQNFYILNNDGGFHGMKIDLQSTDGIQGYNIQRYLEVYNSKSAEKCRRNVTVHKIVI